MRLLRPILTLALSLGPITGTAQDSVPDRPAGPDSLAGADAPAGFPVLVGGDTIIVLRARLGAFGASERAAAATSRLRALVDAGRLRAADSTHVVAEGTVHSLMVGERTVLVVLEGDAEAGSTAARTAREAATRLETALAREVRARTPLRILMGVAVSLLATLLLLAFLHILKRGVRRVRAAAMPWVRRTVPDVGVGGFTLLRASQAARGIDLFITALRWALVTIGLYIYLTVVFRQFTATRHWADQLGDATLRFLGDASRAVLGVVPDLAIVVAIILITRFVTRLTNAFFGGVEDGSVQVEWLHPEVARPTRKLVAIGLWIFAVIIMFPYLPGSDTDAFKGVSIFIGLVLSLGSSGVVGNGMSGLVLMYSRALKVGDVITVGNTTGEVIELGTLATRLRTTKNVVVTLPNSVVAGAEIRNLSRMAEVGALAVPTEVGIGYDAPWRTVHRLLTEAALSVDGVLQDPPPFIRQKSLGDFAVTYELNIHVEDPMAIPRILTDAHAAIQDAFNAAGIEIMSPTFEVKRTGPASTVVQGGGGPADAS